MRQLDFIEKGKLEWREAPAPRLEGAGEALVRPLAVATCDLDLLLVRGLAPVAEPFPFGHECVAEVVDVGDGVEGFAPGDLVSVPFQISCGECDTCRRGNTGNCERVERMAMYGLPMGTNYGGFLSDSVRVPFADAMLVPVPEGIHPAPIASLSDNIPDAWRTVGPQLAERPGAPVLICASGAAIALYATAIALALGAERVEVAVLGGSFLVPRAHFDRVGVGGRGVGLGEARPWGRRAGVVAAGHVGAAGDVLGQDHGDGTAALSRRDAGVACPRERRVARVGGIVDDGPVGVRGAPRRGHDPELVGVDLEAGQRLGLQLAAADRLLLDRAAVDRLGGDRGSTQSHCESYQGDDHCRRGAAHAGELPRRPGA